MNRVKSQRPVPACKAVKLPGVRVGYSIEVRSTVPTLSSCACCGAPHASYVGKNQRAHTLSIPYCSECQDHLAKGRTRRLGITLASLLSAVTFGLALPLLWPELPLLLLLGLVILLGGWPLFLEFFGPVRLEPGHTALDRAAFWSQQGTVVCTRKSFARAIASAPGMSAGAIRATPVQLKQRTPWLGAGPLLASILALLVYGIYTPRLRVLNLSGTTLHVFVDGQRRLSLEPTSAESPLAGADLRLAAGTHQLESRSTAGTVSSRLTADLIAGRRHLYAPAAERYCFWLETSHYGRNGARVEREALRADQRFWMLPRSIDLWFTAAPSITDASRLSGGKLTALRQAPCTPPVTASGR